MSARDRILERLRAAQARREVVEHPGRFVGRRPHAASGTPVDVFEAAFRAAGGACVRLPDLAAARHWIAEVSAGGARVAVGEGVPSDAMPDVERTQPQDADLAISLAEAAVAETGTVILNSRDGRHAQLLAPRHAVLVRADAVSPTLVEALTELRSDLPSAFGLHSGPSKSADIGQVMVQGVHGPGDVTALIVGGRSTSDEAGRADHRAPDRTEGPGRREEGP